jgi:signal peptidase I
VIPPDSQPTEGTAPLTPRRPWLAALLSVLQPGLGHLYAGRPQRALGAWVSTFLAGSTTVFVAAQLPPTLILPLPILAGLLLVVVIAWDAVRCARQAGPAFVPRRYNRWYVYGGVLVGAALVLQPLQLRFFHLFLDAYSLQSPSMEPTLLQGDYIFTKPLHRVPARGELGLCRMHGTIYVKRVVGVPGDTLAMRNDTLLLDGHPVSEPYVRRSPVGELPDSLFAWQRRSVLPDVDTARYHPTQTTWGPIAVPPGTYFVMGDNRDESFDSRHTGFLPADAIRQRPIAIYFSRDPETGKIRWNRIGTLAR